MLNVAVIGLGWWGRTITRRLAGSEELRVVRAVDLFPDRCADYAAEHGIPVGASYDEVLADPGVDVVVLCTPNSLHTAQVAAAARAGKHVFCEKPLALTRAEAEAMVLAAGGGARSVGGGGGGVRNLHAVPVRRSCPPSMNHRGVPMS